MNKQAIILFLTLCYCMNVDARSKYVSEEEDHPYEFGFTIDGQQHRHEKKDANGVIQGEFGFITADGIYHVTVYATDENGNFRILSMRNVRVSGPLDEPNAKLPDTSQFSKKQSTPSVPAPAPLPLSLNSNPPPAQMIRTTTEAHRFTTQPTIKPACAGCGYVTHKTPLNKDNNKLPFQTPAMHNPKPGSVVIGAPAPPIEAPFVSNPLPEIAVGQFEPDVTYPEDYQRPTQQQQFPQVNEEPHSENQPQYNTGNQPQHQQEQTPGQEFTSDGQPEYNIGSQNQQQQSPGQPQFTSGVHPEYNTGVQKTPNQHTPQYITGSQDQQQYDPNYPQTLQGQSPQPQPQPLSLPESEAEYSQPQEPLLNPLTITNPSNDLLSNHNPDDSGITVSNGMINVPNNPPIQIQDKYPNMVDGLPDGINQGDITDLLYRFNYTVGFHGHYEKGYKNGAKVGGYFVTDRDGVSRIVTYVADENGYRPKVKFIRLDLTSDLVPKEGTEKTFGLKNFEFVWYPLN